MPMFEVLYVKEEPFQQEQKRAFTRAAFAIIQDVLKVRPEQIRLVFEHIAPENGHVALLREEPESSEELLQSAPIISISGSSGADVLPGSRSQGE